MSITTETSGSTSLPNAIASGTVPVWDPVVRIFHWGVAILFVVACITGDDAKGAHLTAGYLIAGLLAARIVWGFVGSRHACFTDFVRSPRTALDYLRRSLAGTAPRYRGHNPAGGLMAIALMAMVGAICWSGHLMTTPAYFGSEIMEGLHEALVNVTIALIVLHILGNLFSSMVHRENLTWSMITGRKRA